MSETDAPGDAFTFSDVAYQNEADAFGAYCSLYAHGADVSRGSGPFDGQVRAWRYDKLILFERRLSGVVHSRLERVEADGFNHFTVTALIEGQFRVEADGREFDLPPGAGLLLDMRRRARTAVHGARFFTVAIQRSLVEAAAGPTARLHGRVLEVGPMTLLRDFLASLAAQDGRLPPEAHPAVTRTLVNLLGVAAERSTAKGAAARRAMDAMEAAEAVIARESADPGLTADRIARALGLSRATTYRLFAATGGVARSIDLHRLERLRLRLEAGDLAPLELLAREEGFADAAAARRAFRRRHGIEAETYRASLPGAEDDPVARSRRRWVAWMSEL